MNIRNTVFLPVVVLFFFFSCTSFKEKKRFDALVKEHISLVDKNDSIIFGLVIDEPKDISMAKLYAKGLYSEHGLARYSFNSLNDDLSKLKWDISLSFYNDSLKGIRFYTYVSDLDYIKVKNKLINLYNKKYISSCFYDKSNYFFNGSVMIEIGCEKYLKDKYIIRLSYEQIYWFSQMRPPFFTEKDRYGNDIGNYYSMDYKKQNSVEDPALDVI